MSSSSTAAAATSHEAALPPLERVLRPATKAATHSVSTAAPLPPVVEFDLDGLRWRSLNVPPSELRLDITLSIGQSFGWSRIDATALEIQKAKQEKKRKRTPGAAESPVKASPVKSSPEPDQSPSSSAASAPAVKMENDELGKKIYVKLEAAATATAASSPVSASSLSPIVPLPNSSPVAPQISDPFYVGNLGDSLIGLRQTSNDIWYCLLAGSASLDDLDEKLHDYFHLPHERYFSLHPETSVRVVRHHDCKLRDLYPAWSNHQASTERFKLLTGMFPGVRVLNQDPLETFFTFLCSSNNNIARITQMLTALRKEFGEKMNVEAVPEHIRQLLPDQALYMFPALETLVSNMHEARLREMGFGYRASFLVESAKLLQKKGGNNYLLSLRGETDREKVLSDLVEFKGVGLKVANCIALFSLSQLDCIPVDTHVWKIAQRDYNAVMRKALPGVDFKKMDAPSPKVMQEISRVFREQIFPTKAGWAHCILFLAELPEFKIKVKQMGEGGGMTVTMAKQEQNDQANMEVGDEQENETSEVETKPKKKAKKVKSEADVVVKMEDTDVNSEERTDSDGYATEDEMDYPTAKKGTKRARKSKSKKSASTKAYPQRKTKGAKN